MTTTHIGRPMELLGVHPGISVIDPASVLTRLWYFDGKFLRAEGFRLDQQYVRSLVALSNQAVGHGVVHGFDVHRRSGATLRIDGGLALAPSGRVIFLPSEVDLSVAELIARSSGEIDPARPARGDVADFAPCPPEVVVDPLTTVPPRPIYVLTVAATEALCGEEERFDKLCSDACATDTDRSVAIEGVRFRVRRLTLSLPTSARVSLDDRHLRSRVATAYFARERRAVGSLISGAGLRSDVWCDGADSIGGEEIPLAVFEHSGSIVSWLDMWIARRELIETTPQRYWAWRLAMRPLDVALAQLLQFQCQLADGDPDDGGGRDPGPCAASATVLAEADDVLGSVLAGDPAGASAAMLSELRIRISETLSGSSMPASGSMLIDRGLISLPPGGYLPVDPARPVEPQVHALMGPGVDLRFCAVRPDFIPEALQEAQHMERISLTQGIDDPAELEAVDVLVPGGVLADRPDDLQAFEGRIRLLPSQRVLNRREIKGSVLSLTAVARDQVQEGWSWTLAAYGEAPHRLALGDLTSLFGVFGGGGPAEGPDEAEMKLYVESDEANEKIMSDPAFVLRANRESSYARVRAERVLHDMGDAFEAVREEATPDRAVARDERRPVSLWFDVEAGRDLREVPIGGGTSLRLRAATYSRGSREPLLVDVQITGSLIVRSKVERTAGPGSRTVDIVTDLVGGASLLLVVGGDVTGPVSAGTSGASLRWKVGISSAGVRILSVRVQRAGGTFVAGFEDLGEPRQVDGKLLRTPKGEAPGLDHSMLAGNWTPSETFDGSVVVADLALAETPGALGPGSSGRALAEAVIGTIGAELALRERDDAFDLHARQRLLGAGRRAGQPSIGATADWVMFHRRRTKVCAGAPERPTTLRRLRWFHAVIQADGDIKAFAALAAKPENAGRVDQLGFEPIAVLEFPEDSTELVSSRVAVRAAWAAGARGADLVVGIVASPATSDGPHVDLGRLMSATSTVADLIDTSKLRTSVIPEIPVEFQSPGIDAAIFTIAREAKEVEHYSALLVRQTREEHVNLLNLLRSLGPNDEITSELLEKFLDGTDRFVARFTGPDLDNGDEVAVWWSPTWEALHGAYGISELMDGVTGAAGLAATWIDHLATTLAVQKFDHLGGFTWALPDAHMVVFIVGVKTDQQVIS